MHSALVSAERLLGVFAAGNFLADQFQSKKCRVAFVHVVDRRLHAEGAQEPHSADAEQNFLHDARRAVAAVNAQRQVAEMLLVLRSVGVE
jgi:hypothetical protein